MLTPLDDFYQQKEEPLRGCLLALKHIILGLDTQITAEWKYKLPFFYYKGKMFCYLWFHKKYKKPYIGIVESKHIDHPDLLIEKRARMKIMLIDPEQDLPVETIKNILKQAIAKY
ncbi:MAG: DUF1801 domain-containing protein [Candidatus Pedobacter colombiensis]|uniref:DUF1801 domain-containing protein n=1 Tax=Candidatus Pedobacter colombiensis TaxID=3121371 RepID=A0AAJ5W9U3_9SPHI|nr:DUF1801 domain-containing protein [Pedobacter sp.]WEK20646.1 MAG: DUF1801 domain-containing protein [Pedobacter sp.]